VPEAAFARPGDHVLLLGLDGAEFGGSAYLRLLFGVEQGRPPAIDLAAEARLQELLRHLGYEGLLRTAHDLAEGGLAVAAAEACFGRSLGARLTVPMTPTALFSESQARALVATSPALADRVLEAAEEAGVPARLLGEVGGERLEIHADGEALIADVAELRAAWTTALPRALGL
jgi:phosphoribosylformylglycinamidine synthase